MAPTPKWDNIAMPNEVQTAQGSVLSEERRHRDERADRRRGAGDPALAHGTRAVLAEAELLAHLFLERALGVGHDGRGHLARLGLGHPLGLVHQAQLLFLELGHEPDFLPLHRDLVLVHLTLALGGEIAGGAHRERIGHHPGEARDDHRVIGRRRVPVCAPTMPARRPKLAVSPSLNP